MRITYNFMTMKYLNGISNTLTNVVDSNEKVQAGRNLLRPEHDPVNYLTAFNLQRYVDDSNQYIRNANNAQTWLNNEDTELQTASKIISKAKDDLAITGRNDSQNATSRKALAGEVLNIYRSMIDIGNAEYMDRHIFGGYQTEHKPFTAEEREITSVVSNKSGGEAFASKLYSDMPDLKEGSYTLMATVSAGVVKITMTDSLNRNVILDTNGSDDTTENGNLTNATLTTEYREGMVINTGRGVAIKLPDTNMEGDVLKLQFQYKPGDDIRYIGDDGKINTNIASNQDVTLNVTGQELFMETHRTVQGTVKNTINGISISETTYFSQIDGGNISKADSIDFSGTDHNGYKIGNARIAAPGNVTLDMTDSTDLQRSIQLTYAGATTTLTLDKKGYSDTKEIVFNINKQLDNAGLGGEITAVNDGDKIMFMTNKTGNNVHLKVRGSDHNTLGFKNTLLEASGKDTTFEIAYDDYRGPVETKHTNIAIAAGPHTHYVNGVPLEFTLTAADIAAPDTHDRIEAKLNAALKDKDMNFQYYARVDANATNFDITFVTENQNLTKDTLLATRVGNDYQSATPRQNEFPLQDEKRMSDMLEFIENLYDNAVDAKLVDGKVQVKDLRAGSSRLTFNMTEKNSGIGYPMLDKNIVFSGRYSGNADEKWSTNINVAGGNITIVVKDSKGNTMYDNTAHPIKQNDYKGEPIHISQGISMSLGEITASTSFTTELTANSNMSFGDLNVIEDGENVNVFKTLDNLHDALFHNIPDSGIGAPSAWKSDSLKSTAVPYFDGKFRGNYNEKFNFEVQYNDDKNEFYIQKEQVYTSESVKYFDSTDISMDILFKESGSDQTRTKQINVAAGAYSNPDELIENVIGQINADPDLQKMGVVAFNDDGKLRIKSGSGSTEISTHYDNVGTAMTFGQVASATKATQIPKLDVQPPGATFQINYRNGGAWTTQDITIPAGTYADNTALVAATQAQINAVPALNGNVTLAMGPDGKILFNNSAPVADIVVSGDSNGTLGFYKTPSLNTVKAPDNPTLDVSQKGLEERTMTFTHEVGGVFTETNIIVDAENFQTVDDLIKNMNEKLTAAGLANVEVVKIGETDIGFEFSGAIDSLHVAGDHKGTFGVQKGGDVAKMKVTNSDGDLINVYTIDTANKKQAVVDGVYHHYDAGKLFATDSYDVAIGSGIEYEQPILERAETQIHTSLTVVGNRANRVESAISFNTAMVTKNEEVKAQYTGSTTLDKSKAITDFTVAQNAYQAALKSTAQVLQVSLLNYL